MLYAARDYVQIRRWLDTHAKTRDALGKVRRMSKEKAYAVKTADWKTARAIQREIKNLEEQAEYELELQEVLEFFHSDYCQMISHIDPDDFLDGIDRKLEQDSNFIIKFGDDI